MTKYFVIAAPSSKGLARKIAKKMNAKMLKTTLKMFPDGESKITISEQVKGGTIIVVSSTGPPVDSNLIYTWLLISKAHEMSSNVIAVIPYMGYAKQDKEFLKGEITTLSVVAKLFKAVSTTKLIVVDFHNPDALSFFKMQTKNLSAIPTFVEYFRKYKLKNPIIVSPDMYWKPQASEMADFFNSDFFALNKQRNRKTGELTIKSHVPKFSKNCDLILLDDMISSGGSILKAIEFLGKENFRKIYVVCTHPVLVGDSAQKIKKMGVKEIIGTNSIEGKFSKIDLSKIIVEAIRKWDSSSK